MHSLLRIPVNEWRGTRCLRCRRMWRGKGTHFLQRCHGAFCPQ